MSNFKFKFLIQLRVPVEASICYEICDTEKSLGIKFCEARNSKVITNNIKKYLKK